MGGILGRITTLVLCRQSPLNLHQFSLTRDSKYGLVRTDRNAICWYLASIGLYLALLFIMSIELKSSIGGQTNFSANFSIQCTQRFKPVDSRLLTLKTETYPFNKKKYCREEKVVLRWNALFSGRH